MIVISDGNENYERFVNFEASDWVTVCEGTRLSPYQVKYLLATGTELDAVRSQIQGIPFANGGPTGEVTWYGDHAKFIAANLDLSRVEREG